MVQRSSQSSERSVKSWWKRLCSKKNTTPHVSVVPLPEKYIHEASEMMFVGGKQVPFLPKQIAAIKARSSWDELGRIDERKEGFEIKKTPNPDNELNKATMALAMQTTMF